jgi:hypothetical protein
MEVSDISRALDEVDWSQLAGAYGTSEKNVPNAILTLARERHADTDDWNDSIDVLFSHVSHQGTIFAVTPHVVPFLFDLVALESCADPGTLAYMLAHYAAAATKDAKNGPHVLARIAERRDTILEWIDDKRLANSALFLWSRLSTDARLFDRLESKRTLSAAAYVMFAEMAAPPAWALARAQKALRNKAEGAKMAAAMLLARRSAGALDEDTLTRVQDALVPGTAAKLRQLVEAPFEIEVVHPPFRGKLEEASVLFVGDGLVVVRRGKANINIRWGGDPRPAKGAIVRVGVTHGVAHVIEFDAADGSRRRFEP